MERKRFQQETFFSTFKVTSSRFLLINGSWKGTGMDIVSQFNFLILTLAHIWGYNHVLCFFTPLSAVSIVQERSFSHHPEPMCCCQHRKQEVNPKTPSAGSSADLSFLVRIKLGFRCVFIVPNHRGEKDVGFDLVVFPPFCAAAVGVWAQIQLSSNTHTDTCRVTVLDAPRALEKAPAVQKPNLKKQANKTKKTFPMSS